jgi:hypothetical protein
MKIQATTVPHAHHSPAKAARELLNARTDLATQPFGQVVSKLARGEEIAAATPPTDLVPPPEDSPAMDSTDTPSIQTVDLSV